MTLDEFLVVTILKNYEARRIRDSFRRMRECKTNKSKRKEVCFGGNVLTDRKSAWVFFGPFLIFSMSERIWSENAVGESWTCQLCPFLAKNSVRYYNTVTNNLLCARKQKEKIPKM
jgi:hypothetical protein